MLPRLRMLGRWSAAVLFVTLWCGASGATAQTGYAGIWKAGPSRIAVTVHSWGADCGPRPQSTTQPGGGTVEITEYGRNLAIHATDRTILTNACWSQNRSIARLSSSFLDGVWTTKCRTPPSDPKSEAGEYVLKVENNGTLQYRDSSSYNWELRTSRCVATIVTTQTLTRTTSAATPAAAATAPTKAPATQAPTPAPVEEPEAPEPAGCTAGEPARLVMRPKRAEIEPGQRTCIRAVVLDAAGCVVRGADVRWSLQHSPALRGSLSAGCFEAASSAAEAEGEFKLVAQSGGLRGEAIVAVSTVDFSDLMAKRIETGAVTGHVGADNASAQSQSAARVQTRNEVAAPSIVPLVVIGAGALLALIGLVWWLRKRSAPAPRPTSMRPSAGSMRPMPGAMQPPAGAAPIARAPAAATLAAHADPARPSFMPPSGETWICPTCRRGSPREQITCRCTPSGTPLMPYADFANLGRQAQPDDRKTCGGCGKPCPANAGFCGECGRRF